MRLSSTDYPGARALVKHVRVPALRMRPTVLEAQTDYPPSTRDGCISDFKNTDVIKCSYGDTNADPDHRAGRWLARRALADRAGPARAPAPLQGHHATSRWAARCRPRRCRW